jgi:hypothetical protein
MKLSVSEQKTRELIQPMLDLFGGADGGVGFVRMRAFINDIIEKTDKSALESHFLSDLERMSRLCEGMMK